MTNSFSSMGYPHWLILAGVLLLVLGVVGLALRPRNVEANLTASDRDLVEPEADLTQVEAYNRTAKEKRRDRWAERLGEEPLDAESKTSPAG